MAEYAARTTAGACPFCEIAAGHLSTPGVFWQNEGFMAFLTLDPNTEGFSCVIPKAHHGSDVLKLPDDVLWPLIQASQKAAAMLERAFPDVGRVGVIGEGTGIDHAHIKLVPMHGTEHLRRGEWRQTLSGKEHWFDKYEGWISSADGPRSDPDQLAALAARIADRKK